MHSEQLNQRILSPQYRAAVGQKLREQRLSRYLSQLDAAAALNIMPCHIDLLERGCYEADTEQGLFNRFLDQYAQFSDIDLGDPSFGEQESASRPTQRRPHLGLAATAFAATLAIAPFAEVPHSAFEYAPSSPALSVAVVSPSVKAQGSGIPQHGGGEANAAAVTNYTLSNSLGERAEDADQFIDQMRALAGNS